MKNIMVFDDCQDYLFDIHAVSEEDFFRIFPGPSQNVEFHDDLYKRPDLESLNPVFHRMWFNRRSNTKAMGLHGMLFYENWDRKPFYPHKQDIADPLATIFSLDDRHGKTVLIVDREPSAPILACRADSTLFGLLFRRPGQDVVFYEDIERERDAQTAQDIIAQLKSQVISKTIVQGIDGSLYIGYPERMVYYTNRVESEIPRHYPLND